MTGFAAARDARAVGRLCQDGHALGSWRAHVAGGECGGRRAKPAAECGGDRRRLRAGERQKCAVRGAGAVGGRPPQS
eukprot:5538576-Prymnesium_polylepis.1